MWFVYALLNLAQGSVRPLGIIARDATQFYAIATAPMIHIEITHLLGNTAMLIVLGSATALWGHGVFWRAIAWSVLLGGLFAWAFSAPSTVIIGASGITFGLFSHLVSRALLPERHGRSKALDLLICVLVLVGYGALVAHGVFSPQAGVSWQMHVGGIVGGLAATLQCASTQRAPRIDGR